MKFSKNYRITAEMVCKTGLHIGREIDAIRIGGTDLPVIVDGLTKYPYVPGSSIKGKMRSLLEQNKFGPEQDGKVHNCDNKDCDLCVTFGRGASEGVMAGPTRLIVRDAHPTEKTISMWRSKEDILHGTEVKGENWLNRISSQADPRFIERVPAGSAFDVEMIFSQYDDADSKRLRLVFEALSMLEDNYLGASGSRGYGKVAFSDVRISEKSRDAYTRGDDWKPCDFSKECKTIRDILSVLGA